MSASIPARVRPSLLVWAREQAGYDLATAAEKLHVAEERITAWESESTAERPTVVQARRLAELYKRPLAVFYLPEPPRTFDVLREYRRLHGAPRQPESPELRYALRMADLRRDVFLEMAKEVGDDLPSLSGQASTDEAPEVVGERLRKHLGVSVEKQLGWRTAHQALAEWRRAVESRGVLVLQVPGVPLSEMRATLIPKDPLPVILLNAKDAAPQARLFSILHEFVHLWLTRGGHEIPDLEWDLAPECRPTEVFSNAVAGAALVPADSLRAEWRNFGEDIGSGDDLHPMKALAHRYSVSIEVIARRFLALGRIDQVTYRRIRAQLQAVAPPLAPRKVRIPVHIKALSQLGQWYTDVLLRAYRRELLSGSRLSDYLGIKLGHVQKLENELRGRIFGRAPSPEVA
jgi:Zn-dependent peptidase ImmA (M78 family)/DNA-binding XRE family transcriptional regulator